MNYVFSIAVATCLAGCAAVIPVTNETTGPTITFTNNIGWLPNGTIDVNATSVLLVTAYAQDNGGVKSMNLAFSQSVPGCYSQGGGLQNGPLAYRPIPLSQSAVSIPDSSGKAAIELITVAAGQGPYTCYLPAALTSSHQGTLQPFGQTIFAIATATNYSGKSTTASLPMTFTH
jgi:hypothetical protein